jgi:exopolysaccharide biosynthesis polyprenyl glycosylphosphotransferase
LLYHNVQVMAHSLRFIDALAAVSASTVLVWLGLETAAARDVYRPAVEIFASANLIAFLVIAERMRIYFARRTEDVAGEVFAVSEVGLYSGCIAAVTTEIWGGGLPNYSYLQALGAALLVLPTLRLAMRFTIRRLRRHGGDYRVWLIVGHNDRSLGLADAILANPHFGIRIAEIVDIDDGSGGDSPERRKFEAHPLPGVKLRVVKSVEEIRESVAASVIDEVAVTLPMRTHYDTVSRILEICCGAGISVRIRPQAFEVLGFSTEVSHIGNVPMITHYNGPSNYAQLLVKRVIDVVGAAIGLLALSPFFLAIAAGVKLGSPGPVFFRQTRVGLHGRHFALIKFRSMVKDAQAQRDKLAPENERDGTAFKIRNDARVTPIGKWLRKYHIDEFPQLWNVLVGDMSLVGPRPLPVKEAHGDEWWQRRRLTMPPGLTCLWQIEDDAMTMPFRQWMALDMAYIDRWSIWLDLKLIFRTFATVMRGNGW